MDLVQNSVVVRSRRITALLFALISLCAYLSANDQWTGDQWTGSEWIQSDQVGAVSDPWHMGDPWNRFAYGTGSDGSGVTWNYNACCVEHVPNMIGDFFSGYRGRAVGTGADRVQVLAGVLNAPAVLPAAGSTLTVTQPIGPNVQVFVIGSNPQAILGTVNDNATFTTVQTVAQTQALLANTPGNLNPIPVTPPPASYTTAANNILLQRNGPGTIAYDAASSNARVLVGDALVGGVPMAVAYFYDYTIAVDLSTSNVGVGRGGRQKIANGASPLPQDRVYFHYGFFDDVPLHNNGVDVKRFVPGFERAFFEGNFSMEVRWPFVASLDNNISLGAPLNTNNAQFDNLATYAKFLLYYQPDFAVSAGLGAALPVAESFHVRLPNGRQLARVENQSVHLHPFIGAVYTPNERSFAQGFIQYDFDINGNAVYVNSGTGLRHAGRLHDAAFMSVDLGVGYWTHRSPEGSAGLTGFAPVYELHFNNSLEQPNTINAGTIVLGHFGSNVEALNMTFGGVLEFGPYTHVKAGYVLPVGGDRQHDSGFTIMLDHFPLGR